MKKILLVDDEKDVVDSLGELLKLSLGDELVEITALTDSIDALIAITKDPYDLVITDFKMPRLTGTEFLNNMYNIQSSLNKETPVIIISGFLPNIDNEFGDKPITLLEKPFDIEKLTKIANKHLNI